MRCHQIDPVLFVSIKKNKSWTIKITFIGKKKADHDFQMKIQKGRTGEAQGISVFDSICFTLSKQFEDIVVQPSFGFELMPRPQSKFTEDFS